MEQIALEGPVSLMKISSIIGLDQASPQIDYGCLEPIGLDWESLPDEDFSHLDSIVNLENQQEPSTKSKESHQSFSSSENVGPDARENRTR